MSAKKDNETAEDAALLSLPPQNGNALAEFMGVSRSTITNLARDGILVRVSRGLYDAGESVRRYIRFQRSRAPEKGTEKYSEDVALKRAQRELREMELARMRGELVPVDIVADSIAEVYAMHSEELHALEARLAPFFVGDHAREVLRNEIASLRANLVNGLEKHSAGLERRRGNPKTTRAKKSRAMGRRK